jgi:hypothetical protein
MVLYFVFVFWCFFFLHIFLFRRTKGKTTPEEERLLSSHPTPFWRLKQLFFLSCSPYAQVLHRSIAASNVVAWLIMTFSAWGRIFRSPMAVSHHWALCGYTVWLYSRQAQVGSSSGHWEAVAIIQILFFVADSGTLKVLQSGGPSRMAGRVWTSEGRGKDSKGSGMGGKERGTGRSGQGANQVPAYYSRL